MLFGDENDFDSAEHDSNADACQHEVDQPRIEHTPMIPSHGNLRFGTGE
jgi:hypothetical protein